MNKIPSRRTDTSYQASLPDEQGLEISESMAMEKEAQKLDEQNEAAQILINALVGAILDSDKYKDEIGDVLSELSTQRSVARKVLIEGFGEILIQIPDIKRLYERLFIHPDDAKISIENWTMFSNKWERIRQSILEIISSSPRLRGIINKKSSRIRVVTDEYHDPCLSEIGISKRFNNLFGTKIQNFRGAKGDCRGGSFSEIVEKILKDEDSYEQEFKLLEEGGQVKKGEAVIESSFLIENGKVRDSIQKRMAELGLEILINGDEGILAPVDEYEEY